ncbi:MAG: hypothetical protein WD534_15240 [Phycisphaeraceae bacterium]
MHQQPHAFCDVDHHRFALVTMASVAVDGTPIDPDGGDDLDYFGPVLWENADYAVAVSGDSHQLAIIGPDGSATVLDCHAALRKADTFAARPILGIVIEGGLVQDVVCDRPEHLRDVQLVILDYDVDGIPDDELHAVHHEHGTPAHKAAVRLIEIEQARVDLPTLLREIHGHSE